MKQLLLIAIILGTCQLALSQSLDAFKKSAENAYEAKDYPTAYAHSTEVLEDEPENLTFLKIAGESALELCNFNQSDEHFAKIRSLDSGGSYPLMKFYMAKNQHRQGNYEDAKFYYDDFINTAGPDVDPIYLEIARKKAEECADINELIPSPSLGTVIQPMNNINTGYSNFALPFAGNSLYYSTLTPPENCDCSKPCQDEMNIYQLDNYNSVVPVDFPEGTKNVGHVTFAKEGSRMYFTQCECDNNQYTCAIYYSDQTGGSWSTPIRLPESINRKGYTATQPYFADHYDSRSDALYYVSNFHADYSDRKDLDIYKVIIVNDSITTPVNVVEVNTTGNEVTPFYHLADQSLYFSSNGRQSLGGYDFDIFKYSYGEDNDECDSYGNSLQNPSNVGAPLNSFFDDLYFSKDQGGEKAVFSSNRGTNDYGNEPSSKNSYNQDQASTSEHCCPNIFEANIRSSSTIVVSVFCRANNYGAYSSRILQGSVLTLRNMNDSTASCIPANVEEDYRYYFTDIDLGQPFSVGAEKEGFWGDFQQFNSSFCDGDTVKIDLFLEPVIELQVYFRAKCNPSLEIDVNGVTLFDQSDYTQFSMDAEMGNHTYKAKLRGYRDYRIVPDSVSKTDSSNEYQFSTATPQKDISSCNCCEPGLIRDTFFLEIQPDTFPLFEPLPLYFNHAVPNPIFAAREAATDYETYFNDYYVRQLEFKNATGRCNTLPNYGYRDQSECNCNDELRLVDTFFNEMVINMNRMRSFGGILLRSLNAGDSVVVTIRGVASISGSGGFDNNALSARRINSMEKYLAKYFLLNGDGVTNYMEKVKVKPDPVGASIANSDAPSRGQCRIYNVDASYDRRIEIVSIVFFPPDLQDGPCAVTGYQTTYNQSNNPR
ncbi:MAG: hypothetical protein DHS20C18_19780 [Saprospiraceae bacterium]|nr:MAG: hypothetical protein DHS20C18_19780 [Saprospiraceae bacterium]